MKVRDAQLKVRDAYVTYVRVSVGAVGFGTWHAVSDRMMFRATLVLKVTLVAECRGRFFNLR